MSDKVKTGYSKRFKATVGRLLATPPKPHSDSKIGKAKLGAGDGESKARGPAGRVGNDNRSKRAVTKSRGAKS